MGLNPFKILLYWTGAEKTMDNGETEPVGVIRRRTECTPSDEVHPLGAFYQAYIPALSR